MFVVIGNWSYGKIHGIDKVLLQFKKSLFVLFNPTAEPVNCSIFLKNQKKHLCDLTYKKKTSSNNRKTLLRFDLQKKNFIKHIQNLPQHVSEKFIGDNLSITDIALKN